MKGSGQGSPRNAIVSASVLQVQQKLVIALVLALVFMAAEVAGGVIANSLAILTDAAHLFSDVCGFGIALLAGFCATKKSQSTHKFGYHRIGILGALVSVLSTWLVTGSLLYEAVGRVMHPSPVNGKVMFCLAFLGILVNALIFLILGGHGLLHHGHSHANLQEDTVRHNRDGDVEVGEHAPGHDYGEYSISHEHSHKVGEESIDLGGAILHVVGDFVQSIGVAIAGAVIWWKQDDPRWSIADPICTFASAMLVLFTTCIILRDITDILMERVIGSQDVQAIITAG